MTFRYPKRIKIGQVSICSTARRHDLVYPVTEQWEIPICWKMWKSWNHQGMESIHWPIGETTRGSLKGIFGDFTAAFEFVSSLGQSIHVVSFQWQERRWHDSKKDVTKCVQIQDVCYIHYIYTYIYVYIYIHMYIYIYNMYIYIIYVYI